MLNRLAARVVALGRALATRRSFSYTQQRVLLGLSTLLFVVATVLAARNLPPIEHGIRWVAFVVVGLVGVPATVWLNGAEFSAIARLTGHRIDQLERIRIAVLGAAANLLPVPGSIIVRTEVLRRRGASLRGIGWATAVTAAAWAGMTGLIAGLLLAVLSTRRLGGALAVIVCAAVCTGAALAVRRRRGPDWGPLVRYVLSVEAASILVGGMRLWAVLVGLGFSVGIEQAMALTIAGLVTSAVGFAPGGLGVRELAAAAISPIIGLPASVGLMAAAINRLIELAVLSPLSVGLLARWRSTADLAPAEGEIASP